MRMINGSERIFPANSIRNEGPLKQARHCAYHFVRSLGGTALDGLSGLPHVVAGNIFSATANGIDHLAAAAIQPENERKLKKIVAAVATVLEFAALGYVMSQLSVEFANHVVEFLLGEPIEDDRRTDEIAALIGSAGFAAVGAYFSYEDMTFDEAIWWLLDNRGNWRLNREQQRLIEAMLVAPGQA